MSAISQINLNHLILIALIKYRESFLSDYWRSDLRTQHLSFLPWNSIIFWWIGKKKKQKASRHGREGEHKQHSKIPYWYHWLLVK